MPGGLVWAVLHRGWQSRSLFTVPSRGAARPGGAALPRPGVVGRAAVNRRRRRRSYEVADSVRFQAFREGLPPLDHDCYAAAWQVVYFDRDDEFGMLVSHGDPRRRGVGDRYRCAWVEVELGGEWMCFDRSHGHDWLCPRGKAYTVGDIVAGDVFRYARSAARRFVVGDRDLRAVYR